MFHRIAAFSLSLLLLLQGGPLSANAADSGFADMPEDWSREALTYVVEQGYMRGYNGYLRPHDFAARSELAVILVQVTKVSEVASLDAYDDIDPDAWYVPSLAAAVHAGFLQGDGTKLEPNRLITRQEAFVLFANALPVPAAEVGVLDSFADSDRVAAWAREATAALVAAGYVKGNEVSCLNPEVTITRAELAQMLYNMRVLYESEITDPDVPLSSGAGSSNSDNSGNSNSGSGSGNGGNGNGNSGGGEETPERNTILSSASVINVEQTHFGVIELADGTRTDYDFALNDEVLSETMTNVNDQGTILKFPVIPGETMSLTVTSKTSGAKETVALGTGTAAFSGILTDMLPDHVWASGQMSVFDYHESHYDKNGNIRIYPSKTTFNTVNEGEEPVDERIPALSSAKTPEGEPVVITFDHTDEEAYAWQQAITSVERSYGSSSPCRDQLAYQISDGTITITDSAVTTYNGTHIIAIEATGYDTAYMTVEVIRPAGTIFLSGDYGFWAGQDLLFYLEGFSYGIVNPIHTVRLDGEILRGDCVEYHIISNYVRLERAAHGKLTEGAHTLTIEVTGYADFTLDFTLEAAPAGQKNPTLDEALDAESRSAYSFDAVSSATSGGSTGGETGGSTPMTQAEIIISYDLMVNANILIAIDRATPYSEMVRDGWNNVNKRALIVDNGESKYMDYTYYKNHCGRAEGEDSYYTFADLYRDTETVENIFTDPIPPALCLNRPYSVKHMLEDGYLGEVVSGTQTGAKNHPRLFLSYAGEPEAEFFYGDDIIIRYVNTDDCENWADAITQIQVNGTMPVEGYQVFTGESLEECYIVLPFNSNRLSFGENIFTIQATGYKTASMKITIQKRNESNLKIFQGEGLEIIVTGFSEEYAAALSGVYLNSEGLLNDSQTGGSSGDYALAGNLTLRGHLFTEETYENQHILKLTAYGYEDVILAFTPSLCTPISEANLAEVPSSVKLDETNTYRVNTAVKLVAGTYLDQAYSNALTGILVNGSDAAMTRDSFYGYQISVAAEAFPTAGEYTMTLLADGYKNKVFTVTITDALLPVPDYVKAKSVTISIGDAAEIVLSDYNSGEYEAAFTGIDLDETAIGRQDLSISGYLSKTLSLTDLTFGTHTVVLHAAGYEDKTITITVTGKSVPATVKLVGEDGLINGATLSLETPETVEIAVGDTYYSDQPYKAALSSVTVNDETVSYTESTVSFGMFSTYHTILIPASALQVGDNTITLVAADYQEKTFTVAVANAGTSEPEPEPEPEPELGLEVPSCVKVSSTSISLGGKVEVTLKDFWSGQEYYDKIQSILVDDAALDASVYQNLGYSDYFSLTFSEVGSHTILIQAEGYQDKLFTVEVKAKPVPDKAQFVVNGTLAGTGPLSCSAGEDVVISLSDNYNVSYKNSLTAVTLNGEEIAFSIQVKDVKESAWFSYDYYCITISADLLGEGENTIQLTATGYQEATFVVTVS